MMPLEASALIGSIGGIAEIARASFPDAPVPGAPQPAPATRRGGGVPSVGERS